ncbi:glutamine--fructose-6-phosphate transaminase (isomerizing) [Desulfuromonas thiophila]|uniref:glutamine--fructose-6-phosphate transaminase (isomerizing) n=1 Tax=Desulfuromonas thiophila TaxID=57664 RepID=UPI0029F463A1|nr:glutamine--fructose-6-phosphate transaminase (isomerizing) [Desulfuromonas thiophila]
MCGIVGYIGHQQAVPLIVDGLRRLEYRGYDSAGICVLGPDQQLKTLRAKGKLAQLEQQLAQQALSGTLAIGHTRWATHGKPSEDNAHPHRAGGFVVVHNGIIENYLVLKQQLSAHGHQFRSQTDSEIIAHLIEEAYKQSADFPAAVCQALKQLRGTYAIAVLCDQHPDLLIAARNGSPLVLGNGEGEFFLGSDIPAILSHTRDMIFLNDGEVALLRRAELQIVDLDGNRRPYQSKTITWSPLMAEKSGYRHFMLKEIHEQPRAIADTLAGRISENKAEIILNDIQLSTSCLTGIDRLYLIACGTSWHAALVGKFLIEKLARIPVEVDIASEFRYRDPLINSRCLTLVISQSGETADTLAALRQARTQGAPVLAICNVVESSIARESDGVIYTHAGPEIGVASTKAFTTQLVALVLFALFLAQQRKTLADSQRQELIAALMSLPRLVEEVLQLDEAIEQTVRPYLHARDFLYLGRGNQYPIALEGALKLKEISYIHAEGYPAGEMKHGPIALIDEDLPVLVLAIKNATFAKVCANLEEVHARGGQIFIVSDCDCSDLRALAREYFIIPTTHDDLMPILTSIPLQLLAYHLAVLKGTDVDQPRNLAKSVTVE